MPQASSTARGPAAQRRLVPGMGHHLAALQAPRHRAHSRTTPRPHSRSRTATTPRPAPARAPGQVADPTRCYLAAPGQAAEVRTWPGSRGPARAPANAPRAASCQGACTRCVGCQERVSRQGVWRGDLVSRQGVCVRVCRVLLAHDPCAAACACAVRVHALLHTTSSRARAARHVLLAHVLYCPRPLPRCMLHAICSCCFDAASCNMLMLF